MRRRAQVWLGTLVEVTLADALSDEVANACFDAAFAQLAAVHRRMSFHDPRSELSRLNAAAVGATVTLHPDCVTVLRAGLAVQRRSAGLFNLACARRLQQWAYLPQHERHLTADPSPLPDRALPTLLDARRVRKNSAAPLVLDGIAKGFAVDRAVQALRRRGVRAACVNAGGDLRAFGPLDWPVQVRDPHCPQRIGVTVLLRDAALASSGAYFSASADGERSALVHGQSLAALTGPRSASVQAPRCMLADALTKVVLASGRADHPVLAAYGASAVLL